MPIYDSFTGSVDEWKHFYKFPSVNTVYTCVKLIWNVLCFANLTQSQDEDFHMWDSQTAEPKADIYILLYPTDLTGWEDAYLKLMQDYGIRGTHLTEGLRPVEGQY